MCASRFVTSRGNCALLSDYCAKHDREFADGFDTLRREHVLSPNTEVLNGNRQRRAVCNIEGLSLAMEDNLFRKDAMAAPSLADADRALSASRRAFKRVLASWASDVLVLRKSGHLSMAFRNRRDDNSGWRKAA